MDDALRVRARQGAADMLTSYSDEKYVSDDYGRELSSAGNEGKFLFAYGANASAQKMWPCLYSLS